MKNKKIILLFYLIFTFFSNIAAGDEKIDYSSNILKILENGKIFEKAGVNMSTVSGKFSKDFRHKILGASKDGKYWASGISVVAHMKNPKVPAIHFNTRFIITSEEWFGGGIDVTPSFSDKKEKELTYIDFKNQILADYKTMVLSRETSILGRREVLTGKAKFGIFGDGKELPQIVLSKFFKNGDFRSGYYRDQTILMSQGHLSVREIFSALYANTDNKLEPMSGGRQMGGHFVTRSIDEEGNFRELLIYPEKSKSLNLAFDVTPAKFVTGLITEMGICRANKNEIKKLHRQ